MSSRSNIFLQLTALSRANMTIISGLTYLSAAYLSTITTGATMHTPSFLSGWLFILLTQFATHFLGEVYDRPSDLLNKHATPITGGSRVLTSPSPPISLAFRAGYISLTLSALTIPSLLPPSARPVATAMLFFAWAYSVPPLKLNHRACGEIDASIITSALVPYLASVLQNVSDGYFPWFDSRLSYLVIPPVFAKFALFLVLNLADKRADWAGGKITLPVLYGPHLTAVAHFVSMLLCYLSMAFLCVSRAFQQPWSMLEHLSLILFVAPSAVLAFSVSRGLLVRMPYRLDALLPPTLFQSTLLVWGIVLHTFVWHGGVDLFSIPAFLASVFAYLTVRNFLKGRTAGAKKREAQSAASSHSNPQSVELAHDRVALPTVSSDSDAAQHLRRETTSVEMSPLNTDTPATQTSTYDVVVVGAGVAGLVTVATLRKLGLTAVALERRSSAHQAELGADLALWPGAITILKQLGIKASFFHFDCFPLDKVHMCKMDFDEALHGDAAGAATILKTIDMTAVTDGTNERFVLVSRQALMNALQEIVPPDAVVYGVEVSDVSESEATENVTVSFTTENHHAVPDMLTGGTVTSRVLIAADGARSSLRAHVAPALGQAVRFCREVCYRGVLDFRELQEGGLDATIKSNVIKLFPDLPTDRAMRINYGAGLRSSFGYMSGDGDTAYWWVKEQTPSVPPLAKKQHCGWPEPLKTLHDITPESAFYMHSIDDSASLHRWSSNRVVLVGDAAHVVTPNMGQGACLGTEDGFVIATLLAKNWQWPDGHVEAFYDYERCRKPFAESVASEARKQLFLSQLTNRFAVMLREMLLQMLPASVLQGKLKSNNFAVEPYVRLFRELSEAV